MSRRLRVRLLDKANNEVHRFECDDWDIQGDFIVVKNYGAEIDEPDSKQARSIPGAVVSITADEVDKTVYDDTEFWKTAVKK